MELTQEQKFKFRLRLEQEMEQQKQNSVSQESQQSQPYQPSFLESAADVSQSAQDAIMGPIVGGIASGAKALSKRAFGTEAPAQALGKGIGYLPQKIEQAGEYTSEKLGSMGVNPYVAGAAGMVVANAPYMLLPGGKSTGRAFAPTVPAARQAAVKAAEAEGIALSRAEQTGSRLMTGIENTLEKTPLGSGTMESFRGKAESGMQSLKQRIAPQPKEVSDIGATAKSGMQARKSSMSAQKNALYEAVPDNVSIPLSESTKVADTIIQEQSQYLPTTRNADIIAMAKDIQNAKEGISAGKGVTGGPEIRGVTTRTPDIKVPGETIVTEHPPEYNSAEPVMRGEKPSYFTAEKTPGITIPGKDVYGTKYSVSPEKQFSQKPNYPLLKRLRETLSGKAQDARDSKNFALERDYLRLKSAVDQDIDTYVKGQNTPLGEMIGKEFSESYTKANAFARAYKRLFEGEEADLVRDLSPEHIVDRVFKKNNETAINRFHALVGDDAFKEAKAKWVNELMESGNVQNELGKYESGTLRAILSKPELEEIERYSSVQSIRKTVPNLQGTQGSARSNIAAGSYGGLGYGLMSLMRGDLAGAAVGIGQYAAPYPLAKAVTSEAFRKGIPYTVPGAAKKAVYSQVIDRFINNSRNPGGQ